MEGIDGTLLLGNLLARLFQAFGHPGGSFDQAISRACIMEEYNTETFDFKLFSHYLIVGPKFFLAALPFWAKAREPITLATDGTLRTRSRIITRDGRKRVSLTGLLHPANLCDNPPTTCTHSKTA
jgi:hypothetical protein